MQTRNKLFSSDWYYSNGEILTSAADIRRRAELSLIKGCGIHRHVQLYDELICALSGKASVFCGEEAVEVSAGQIYYIRKGETHRIAAAPEENFRYYCLGFIPQKEHPLTRAFLEQVGSRRFFAVEDRCEIRTLFSMLFQELAAMDERSGDMVCFYFCQILVLLIRTLEGRYGEEQLRLEVSRSNQAVYRALKYLDREYARISRVKEVAEALSYSEYYLSHAFREKMEITMKDYLMQKKLAVAAELLQISDVSITEISSQLHFSSLHAFGLAFKRYMGVSPSSYRKQAAAE